MMSWIFAGITLSAVIMATFVVHMRRAILALWVAGLGVGAVYLTIGAEFLAIVQWIVSTLVTLSFLFFAVMFGEYHSPDPKQKENRLMMTVLSVFLGAVFAGLIYLGASELKEAPRAWVPEGTDLKVVGRTLTHEHLLSLEVLALTLFLVLVGGGVVARSEGSES